MSAGATPKLSEVRDALLRQLDAATAGPAQPSDVDHLASALEHVDKVAFVALKQQGQQAPPFDMEAAIAAVWNATQEAGASTAIGDAAAAALRKAAGQ